MITISWNKFPIAWTRSIIAHMDELNIYFIVFSLTDKKVLSSSIGLFMQHTLIAATPRLIETIIIFSDTFTALPSYSDE